MPRDAYLCARSTEKLNSHISSAAYIKHAHISYDGTLRMQVAGGGNEKGHRVRKRSRASRDLFFPLSANTNWIAFIKTSASVGVSRDGFINDRERGGDAKIFVRPVYLPAIRLPTAATAVFRIAAGETRECLSFIFIHRIQNMHEVHSTPNNFGQVEPTNISNDVAYKTLH